MAVPHAAPPCSLLLAGLVGLAGCPSQGDLGVYTDTAPQSGSDDGSGSTAGPTSNDPPLTTDPTDDLPSTGGSTGTTAAGSATDATTVDESAGSGTTADNGTTTEDDTTAGSTTTDGDPPAQCTAPDPDLLSYAVIYFDPWPGGDALDQEFDGDCALVGVTEDTKLHFNFDCGQSQATIDLLVAPEDLTVDLQPGQSYRLKWVARARGWASNWWFTLSTLDDPPQMLLAGMESTLVLPDDMPDFFAPLSLAYDGDHCGPATDCDDPWDPLIIEMSQGGPLVQVTHKTRKDVGDYRVLANMAGRFRDLHTMARECLEWTDPVPEFFSMTMLHRQD